MQESTIGAAFFTQVVSTNEATVKFDIWDTAGQERYYSLAPMYYRGAAAAVVVYAITSTDSFQRAKKWVQELQRQGNPNLVMFLVANKADLEENTQVQTELVVVFLNEPCGMGSNMLKKMGCLSSKHLPKLQKMSMNSSMI